jgi:SH3-like domain-containing protein
MKAIAGAAGAMMLGWGAAALAQGHPTPSSKPVPRFESLDEEEAHGRLGPTRDHRVVWTYQRVGLPMQVIAETQDWRRVRDPDGEVTWMHKRLLSSRPTVMVRASAAEGVPLRAAPQTDAKVRAVLHAGVIADLETCSDGWCRLRVRQRYEGWTPASMLWGAR